MVETGTTHGGVRGLSNILNQVVVIARFVVYTTFRIEELGTFSQRSVPLGWKSLALSAGSPYLSDGRAWHFRPAVRTFRMKELGAFGRQSVATTCRISGIALLAGTGYCQRVGAQVTHAAHGSHAHDLTCMLVGDVEKTVERADRHEVLVRHLRHTVMRLRTWKKHL